MERTGADGVGPIGGGARADDAHRQAHQCRVSVGGLDPSGQHHDARAGDGAGAARVRVDGERAAAVTAPAGFGQPAAGRGARTGGCRRVMLPKSAAGR